MLTFRNPEDKTSCIVLSCLKMENQWLMVNSLKQSISELIDLLGDFAEVSVDAQLFDGDREPQWVPGRLLVE